MPPPFSPPSLLRRCCGSFRLSTYHLQKPKWNTNLNLVVTHPLLSLMESCSSLADLNKIQALLTVAGLMSQRFPASRVIAFCALSDPPHMSRAARVLATLPTPPNTYTLNTMIRGYVRDNSHILAFNLFHDMIRSALRSLIDARTLVFALKASEHLCDSFAGESIQCTIYKLGFAKELLVRNGLLHFYVKVGSFCCAQKLFDEMCERDVVSWTTLIDGCAQLGLPDEAIRAFSQMMATDTVPNDVTMVAVLSACSRLDSLRLGKLVHGYILKNDVLGTISLLNALVDMYGKCGCVGSAKEIFYSIEIKDVVSWTSLLNAYAKCGCLELARQVFNQMPEKNVISWSSMIAAYSHADLPNEALKMFSEMIATGVQPIDGTLVSVLSACAQSGSFHIGNWIYEHYIVKEKTKLSLNLINAFVEMYAKCGAIEAAIKLFDNMQERNIVSWNTMIMAYAVHGFADDALRLFEELKSMKVMPDDITFVGVLSACTHGGLVAEGRKHFRDMNAIFGIEPKIEHYACLIDLLSRVGLLEDAYELVTTMPLQLDKAGWGSLLSACKMHGNADLGKFVGDKLLGLDSGDSGIYALLANIYAARNKWDEVKSIRSMMRVKGIKKTPGCSTIELDGKFHQFLSADKSHIQSKEIYMVLDEIYFHLRKKG